MYLGVSEVLSFFFTVVQGLLVGSPLPVRVQVLLAEDGVKLCDFGLTQSGVLREQCPRSEIV